MLYRCFSRARFSDMKSDGFVVRMVVKKSFCPHSLSHKHPLFHPHKEKKLTHYSGGTGRKGKINYRHVASTGLSNVPH